MRALAAFALGFGLLGFADAANASGCPGNPGAMGTSRVLKIDPRAHPRIGTVQYQDTLPLNDKEVVLTFDDGPMPPYTNRVLETLAHECVKANFFIVGRMARGYPELLRRIHAEGHVIGTHSENHPLAFEKMPLRAVQAEIDQGFASTTAALGSQGTVAPFFRIPGLLRAETVESHLASRGMVTWSADVVADDWKHITAAEVVSRSIARLDARGKGILLLHDIQPATALALPHLLRELKRRGYKIVLVQPEDTPPLVARAAPRQPQATAIATQTVVASQPAQPQVQQSHVTLVRPQPLPATPVPVVQAPPLPVVSPAVPAVPVTAQAATQRTVAMPAEAAAANASPVAANPQLAGSAVASPAPAVPSEPSEPLPIARAMPVPILEAVRPAPAAPGAAPGATPERPAETQQAIRPLTPGFKPSHSDTLPTKVSDFLAEPPPPQPPQQQAPAEQAPSDQPPAPPDQAGAEGVPSPPAREIDVWSSRASLSPPPRTAWPVAAATLAPAARR